MSYWKTLLSRAFSESWDLVVGQPLLSLVVAVVAFLVGFRIKRWIGGEEAVEGSLIDGLVGFATAAAIVVAVFLIHFLFITPARMYRMKEAELAAMTARVQQDRARYVSRDAYIEFLQLPKKTTGVFFIRVKLANVGKNGAIDSESDLFMIDASLQKPPTQNSNSLTNEIIGETLLGVNSEPLQLTQNDPKLFIAVVIRFVDAITREKHQQEFFYKFNGTNETGDFLNALWGLSVLEKREVIAYLTRRDLVKFQD